MKERKRLMARFTRAGEEARATIRQNLPIWSAQDVTRAPATYERKLEWKMG